MKAFLIAIIVSLSSAALPVQGQSANTAGNKHLIKNQFEPVTVYDQGNNKISLSILSVDTSIYIDMAGVNLGSATINKHDQAVFTLSNGQQVIARSVALQSFQPDIKHNSYQHRYLINQFDLQSLSQYKLESIRKYMFNEFIDIEITDEKAAQLKRRNQLYVKQLNKPLQASMVKSADLTNIHEYIGDSVVFCGKVFLVRTFQSPTSRATILDFQYSRSAPMARAILWQEDEKNFGPVSRSFYSKKDVCITGRVYLYDGIPYIQLSHPAQIREIQSDRAL